jgi:hypothetical protein
VKSLEFGASSAILVPLLCSLKDHDIIGSALLAGSLLIVDLVEQRHLLVIGGPVIF